MVDAGRDNGGDCCGDVDISSTKRIHGMHDHSFLLLFDGGRTRLQRLARWPTTSPSASMTNWSDSKKHGTLLEANYFQPIDHENLVQGSLYIIKVKIVTISLFEGWNDDMCCFSVLRSDTGSMRWSEARYLPGDFDAFDAFDDAGNPPVYFWTRYLRIDVPLNWFSLFEEARQRQRKWNMDVQQQYIYQQEQQQQHQHQHQRHQQQRIDTTATNNGNVDDADEEDEILSFPAPPSSISSLPLDINGDNDLPLGSSFSQVRHGSPTIFTNIDAPCVPPSTVATLTTTTTNKNDTYISPYPLPPPPPLPIDTHFPPVSPSTTAAVAAFPTSSSSSSPPPPPPAAKLDTQPNHQIDQLVYSPVPSIRHSSKGMVNKTTTASTTLSASTKSQQYRRFSQQITNDRKSNDPTALPPNNHKSKFSRSMSIKSLSRNRRSVFGLF
ncbi:hypothetical protein BCR42DRAFT_493349 [Absidia repens]|uniref:Uncharacterized protein n=1 Tax=Absidia repens TaxID=90262 RepID=A0A1X2IBH9_9FUNG|nr:hypothetical protein BCR42DRAFT_493349 [Absidia repens]